MVAGIASFAKNRDLAEAEKLRSENPERYCLGYTWFGVFERFWLLRGMENTMLDFYDQPENAKKMMRALCDFHIQAIRRFGELGYNGIAMSDDLGAQTNTMFSREIFLEFFKPLYTEMFAVAHSYGMQTWMHSCGHVLPLLGDLIDAGLDVIHPIQHSTYPGGTSANDPQLVAKEFGGKITFWAGIDVQYLLPRGTPEEVRSGVRKLIDTFDGADGGLVIAAGNGIPPETPFENIEAFFDEAYIYGREKRAREQKLKHQKEHRS